MKTIGVFVKIDARAAEKADELQKWLQSKGVNVIRKDSARYSHEFNSKNNSIAPQDLFCVFVLGGDGTFLRAVRWIRNQDVPILGIKFAEVGFLSEITEEKMFDAVKLILSSNFITKPRTRLLVKVIRKDREVACETVLNEIVINKGHFASLARIKTYIDDVYLTTYRADGLIVSTPAGSTAYSLSANGPIIHPDVKGIVVTPICPFTLTVRPLVVPDSVCMKIRLKKKSSDIMITFDGQTGLEISPEDTIIIKKSNHPVSMITMPDQNYFDVLKTKLNWSGARI